MNTMASSPKILAFSGSTRRESLNKKFLAVAVQEVKNAGGEVTLIDLRDLSVWGLARPVSLKNASIDVIRNFEPGAWFTSPVRDTAKGTVALMAPPAASVAGMGLAAKPRWLVLPRYQAGAPATLTALTPANAFMQLADNAMNYHILGEQGFHAVGALTDRCQHYSFSYGNLDEAIAVFDDLARRA